MHIRIYGPGCARCHETERVVEETERVVEDVVRESRSDATLEKISGLMEIATSGILSVPAVTIDGKIMCQGRVPSRAEVLGWLETRRQDKS